METEGHYKQKADNYRNSEQYVKMVGLYPVLGNSIKECQGEKLVA